MFTLCSSSPSVQPTAAAIFLPLIQRHLAPVHSPTTVWNSAGVCLDVIGNNVTSSSRVSDSTSPVQMRVAPDMQAEVVSLRTASHADDPSHKPEVEQKDQESRGTSGDVEHSSWRLRHLCEDEAARSCSDQGEDCARPSSADNVVNNAECRVNDDSQLKRTADGNRKIRTDEITDMRCEQIASSLGNQSGLGQNKVTLKFGIDRLLDDTNNKTAPSSGK
jgi:hypothetical protein